MTVTAMIMWFVGYAVFWVISRFLISFVLTLIGFNKREDEVLHVLSWIPFIGEMLIIFGPILFLGIFTAVAIKESAENLASSLQKNLKSRFPNRERE